MSTDPAQSQFTSQNRNIIDFKEYPEVCSKCFSISTTPLVNGNPTTAQYWTFDPSRTSIVINNLIVIGRAYSRPVDSFLWFIEIDPLSYQNNRIRGKISTKNAEKGVLRNLSLGDYTSISSSYFEFTPL
jgi:hypothetical protein